MMKRHQQGMTLLMALIMLVVLTMLALTSFNLGKSNLQIVSNMQQRDASLAAAREVIEEVISRNAFNESPAETLVATCGANNRRCIDINGDNAADITVELTPNPYCVKAKTVKTAALDVTVTEDSGCTLGSGNLPGVVGANTGNSLCADSVWEVRAVATDDLTKANVTVTQGIGVRGSVDEIKTNCPD
jgi:Tfp pilus assembly protein PilX